MSKILHTFAMIGDSLTGGYQAERPEFTFFAQFTKILKANGHASYAIPTNQAGAPGTAAFGQMYDQWTRLVRGRIPDLILLQGTIEHESATSQPTALASNLTAFDNIINFNQAPANDIYQITDGTHKEWVYVDGSFAVACRRGIMSASASGPRHWPLGSTVLANTSTTTWAGLAAHQAKLDALIREILAASPNTVILVCDGWFTMAADVVTGMRNYVAGLRLPNVAFVEYIDPYGSGSRIYSDPLASGPSATVTTIAETGGPPGALTITCNDANGIQLANLKPNTYVLLWDSTAFPAAPAIGSAGATGAEIIHLPGAFDSATQLTVPVGNRNQMGSAVSAAINTGHQFYLCNYAGINDQPLANFDNQGGSLPASVAWAYSGHPNAYGYSLLAQRAWQVVQSVLASSN